MFEKNLTTLLVLFLATFIFGSTTAGAQETEAAAESHLLQIMLPQSAQRVLPQSVPAEITQMFEKVTAASGGKFRQGETEVLLFTGANYKRANAAGIVNRFAGAVKNAGWKYAVEGEENGVTLFSALQENPRRRAVVGFHGATDDALILAAMEILPNDGNGVGNGKGEQSQTEDESQTEQPPVNTKPARTSSGGGSIVGEWSNGYSSTVGYTPKVGPPSYTPSKSRVWTYKFHPNGTYKFTGLMQITLAGCTSTYFQDKRGRYTINGNQVALTLTKNLWRKGESCAASGNTEKEGEHIPETYTFSVSRNENGKEQVCLDSGGGEGSLVCYERAKK